jgi:DNA polymerase-3 subunit delta'
LSAIAEVSGHQARVGPALEAAIGEGPSHAYLFRGPSGSGKRRLARAFAAEILASASSDPAETRRRALLDPSPHPDLVWLKPVGMSHAVADVRERVIHQAPLSPFEGGSRVFVIEAADALNEESQNAMLKTLEEPPVHAHLVLISSESEGVLPTVASRCQVVEFDALGQDLIEAELADVASPEHARAAARLSRGDLARARLLARERGRQIREAVEAMMGAAAADRLGDAPWLKVLTMAKDAGDQAGERVAAELDGEVEEGIKHTKTEIEEATRRAQRRARTGVLDLSLSLAAAWARDWAAVVSGAPELVFNTDRLDALAGQADGMTLAAARGSVELIADTRRRFELNVSEELALEALCFRIARLTNPV